MDKVSVIMSVYKENRNQLKGAIESILNQTYKNFEFIIILDNPKEQWIMDFIKQYNDERIRLIINEKNIGLPKSLNKGIKISTGDYIARMDADDISLPTRFEEQIKFLKETNYDMCGTFVTCFIGEKDFEQIKFPIKYEDFNKLIFKKNCISHPTYMVKKEVYKMLNGYQNIFSCEDYDFIFRVIKKGYKIGNVPQILLRYRISPNSISRTNAGKQELIARYLKKTYKANGTVSEEKINEYISSKDYKRKLKSYDYYWGMKNTRSKYKNKKFPMYYIYTALLIFNFRHSSKEIIRKLYDKIYTK